MKYLLHRKHLTTLKIWLLMKGIPCITETKGNYQVLGIKHKHGLGFLYASNKTSRLTVAKDIQPIINTYLSEYSTKSKLELAIERKLYVEQNQNSQ